MSKSGKDRLLPLLLGGGKSGRHTEPARWLPGAEAAFLAVALVVLGGCETIEQAYQAVEWKPVFTIAAILPIGLAVNGTRAAAWLSQTLVRNLGRTELLVLARRLFGLTVGFAQFVGGPVVVAVALAPVAIAAAQQTGLAPHPLGGGGWGCSTALLS